MREGLLARNTILNFIGLIVPLVVGVVTVPVVIHHLGTERYGIFSLVLVVFSYFGLFDFGLGRATTKYIAESLGRRDLETMPKYLWTTVAFQGILGILGGVLLVLVTPLLVEKIIHIPPQYILESKETFYFLAASLPFVLAAPSFRGVLEAGQRFDLVNAIKIPTNVLIYVLPLLAVILGYGLRGIVVLLNISRIITLFVWMGACLKIYPILRKRSFLPKSDLRPLLSFSGWNALSSMVWPILASLDRFFIGAIQDVKAVSYYAAPNEVIMRMGVIPGSLSLTLFPAFSSLEGGGAKERMRNLFGRSLRFTMLVAGSAVVFIMFFAHDILKIWLGEKFADQGTLVFQILAVGFFLTTLTNVAYNYLQGIGRADLTTKFQLVEFLFYVPLLWILIKAWGIQGAALAWVIRYGVDMILHFGTSHRIGNLGFRVLASAENMRTWGVLAGLGLAFFLSRNLPFCPFWIVLSVCGFVYSSWFLVLKNSERQWFAGHFRFFGFDKWLLRIPNVFVRCHWFL